MLVRIRPGLLAFAALLAGPIAACSSSSSDDAAETSATSHSNTSDSGGSQGSGGSAGSGGSGTGTNGNVTGTASSGINTSTSGPNTTSANTTGTNGGSGGSAGGNGGGSAGGNSGGAGGPSELPYANVVAVAASGDEGSYTFNVSVESADVDCSQFADWWEVVSEDGTLLYRRILEHSHTDENGTSDANAPGNTFTRSGGPVNVLENDVVLVRAHMSNLDEYNGTVMRGSVADGFATATDLDPAFAAELESAAPEPETCLF